MMKTQDEVIWAGEKIYRKCTKILTWIRAFGSRDWGQYVFPEICALRMAFLNRLDC